MNRGPSASSGRPAGPPAGRPGLRRRTWRVLAARTVPAVLAGVVSAAGPDGGPVFIAPDRARQRIVRDQAAVLDARGREARPPYLPDARTIDWRDYRDGWLRSGRLTDDIERLRRALEDRGVDSDRPVLVYADMGAGWGEEGRIWWTLTYLGHPDVRILNGGVSAWRQAGLPVAPRPAKDSPPARFEVRVRPALRATASEIRGAGDQTVLLDVRSKEEFEGARPYFSSRGGRIPGAAHLPWKAFIGLEGRLKPASEIRAMMGAEGVTTGEDIVVYCTGGVRSAFAQAALIHAGFPRVRNYDASWWEWASERALPIER